MIGLKNEEILTCLMLVVIGYFIAKMFSRSCNGFSVGGQQCTQLVRERLNNMPGGQRPLESDCQNMRCGFDPNMNGGICKECEEHNYNNCNNIHNCRYEEHYDQYYNDGQCIFNGPEEPPPPPPPPPPETKTGCVAKYNPQYRPCTRINNYSNFIDRQNSCVADSNCEWIPEPAADCTQILNNVYTNCPDNPIDALTDECCSTLNAVLDNQNRCQEWPNKALDIVNENILRCP